MGRARAVDLAIPVVAGEVVGCAWFDGDELKDARFVHSGAVESDRQGARARVEFSGVERERNTGLLAILPIESPVQHIKMEIAVDDQVIGRGQVSIQTEQGSCLPP